MTALTGADVASLLRGQQVTDVVGVPDSTIGQWESAIAEAGIRLIRVCREGEAWGVACGLHLGGRRPLVMIQCTGFFESGDALRNALHDWKLPIPAIIGYRSFLNQETIPGDTCLVFTEPVLDAWNLDYVLIKNADGMDTAAAHLDRCREAGKPGVILVAEGKA
jgi:sulfopyruvate decarboxylase TPP-binding subunit